MIFDNGWISVEEVDKLPPHSKRCQVLLVNVGSAGETLVTTGYMDRDCWVTGDARSEALAVIAHQPLALPPTKPTLIARMVSRIDWSAAPAAIAMEIIEIIDSERAIDTPFDAADMENLRNCYARALAYETADEAVSLARAIDRLEAVT